MHKHNYTECEGKSEGSVTRQTAAGTLSSLLASVAVMLFQTDEAYSNSDLTKVQYNNNKLSIVCLFVFGATAPQWVSASSFTRLLDHTQRRITVGRTPLEE